MSRPLDRARSAIARLCAGEPALLGVSGGADSLALAVAASELVAAGKLQAGAVIVDHGLQAGSAEVSARAAEQCRSLGLDPVSTVAVRSAPSEAAARTARYAAFDNALSESGAAHLLLGHTRDDQAEQVLLGLLRGSGTRSLAGMPERRGPYARPLLGLSRAETEQICRRAGLDFWVDPSNEDTGYRRNAVRHEVLPALERSLGPGIRSALVRTAELAAADAEALEEWAQTEFARLTRSEGIDLKQLRQLPLAVGTRVLRLAAVHAGARNLGHERTAALAGLAGVGGRASRSAGPVQLEGGISAWRRGPVIVFTEGG